MGTKRYRSMTLIPGGQQPAKASTAHASIGFSTKYDEAEFLVGGKSTGPGDVEKEWFKIHEGYVAECSKILQSGKFPYDTMSDIYRHAVVRHVHWLHQLEEIEGSILRELDQIGEIVAEEERMVKFAKSIENIAGVVEDVINQPGGKAEAGRLLRRMRKHIDSMRPCFWKNNYERLFLQKFGHLLNEGIWLLSKGSADEALAYDAAEMELTALEDDEA